MRQPRRTCDFGEGSLSLYCVDELDNSIKKKNITLILLKDANLIQVFHSSHGSGRGESLLPCCLSSSLVVIPS